MIKRDKDNAKKEEVKQGGDSEEEEEINEDSEERELLGPLGEYVPQEEIAFESSLEVASLKEYKSMYLCKKKYQNVQIYL